MITTTTKLICFMTTKQEKDGLGVVYFLIFYKIQLNFNYYLTQVKL